MAQLASCKNLFILLQQMVDYLISVSKKTHTDSKRVDFAPEPRSLEVMAHGYCFSSWMDQRKDERKQER